MRWNALIFQKFQRKTLHKNALKCAEMRWNFAIKGLKIAESSKQNAGWDANYALRWRNLHSIHCAID